MDGESPRINYGHAVYVDLTIVVFLGCFFVSISFYLLVDFYSFMWCSEFLAHGQIGKGK